MNSLLTCPTFASPIPSARAISVSLVRGGNASGWGGLWMTALLSTVCAELGLDAPGCATIVDPLKGGRLSLSVLGQVRPPSHGVGGQDCAVLVPPPPLLGSEGDVRLDSALEDGVLDFGRFVAEADQGAQPRRAPVEGRLERLRVD